jgi:hypothetical protein
MPANNLDKALDVFAKAIKHRPRINLTIRQRTRVSNGGRRDEPRRGKSHI